MLFPKDPKVKVTRQKEKLTIAWPWDRSGSVVVVVMGCLVVFFSVIVGYTPKTNGEPRTLSEQTAVVVVCSLLALPMIVGGLAFALNRTELVAEPETITVRSKPFGFRTRTYKTSGVKQFFFIRSSTTQTASSSFRALHMLDAEDHAWLIAGFFPTGFALAQVCHELQDFYHLEDLPVYGQTADPSHNRPRTPQ